MSEGTPRSSSGLVRAMLDLSPAGVLRLLATIALALVAIDLTLMILHYKVVEIHWLLKDAFDLDNEENFPTWFSSAILLFSALLLFTVANARRAEGDKSSGYWRALAFGFVYLSFDETAGLHEILNTYMDEVRGDHTFSWAYFGAAVIAIVGIAFVRFLAKLPVRYRNLFYATGVIYGTGVVGLEIVSNFYLKTHDIDTLGYNVWAAVEEGLEMAGVILFIYAVLSYMRTIPSLRTPEA